MPNKLVSTASQARTKPESMLAKQETARQTIKRSVAEVDNKSNKNSDSEKSDKLDVNYTMASSEDRCGVCEYFIKPKKQGAVRAPPLNIEGKCKKVLGGIHPEYVCDLFELSANADTENNELDGEMG